MAIKKKEIQYIPQGVTTKIEAHSRISTKLNDTFYTFEFVETLEFPVDLVDEGKIDFSKEKELLWDSVHEQVDKQVQDVVTLLKKGK